MCKQMKNAKSGNNFAGQCDMTEAINCGISVSVVAKISNLRQKLV